MHPAGAKLTMKQACFLLLEFRRNWDTAFDVLMRMLVGVLMPEGNILAPALYLRHKSFILGRETGAKLLS